MPFSLRLPVPGTDVNVHTVTQGYNEKVLVMNLISFFRIPESYSVIPSEFSISH